MNTMLVEHNCGDCPLRVLEMIQGGEPMPAALRPEPEDAPERQLEQLERSFGPDWKW